MVHTSFTDWPIFSPSRICDVTKRLEKHSWSFPRSVSWWRRQGNGQKKRKLIKCCVVALISGRSSLSASTTQFLIRRNKPAHTHLRVHRFGASSLPPTAPPPPGGGGGWPIIAGPVPELLGVEGRGEGRGVHRGPPRAGALPQPPQQALRRLRNFILRDGYISQVYTNDWRNWKDAGIWKWHGQKKQSPSNLLWPWWSCNADKDWLCTRFSTRDQSPGCIKGTASWWLASHTPLL